MLNILNIFFLLYNFFIVIMFLLYLIINKKIINNSSCLTMNYLVWKSIYCCCWLQKVDGTWCLVNGRFCNALVVNYFILVLFRVLVYYLNINMWFYGVVYVIIWFIIVIISVGENNKYLEVLGVIFNKKKLKGSY